MGILRTKITVGVLPLALLMTGLLVVSILQPPHGAHSQTDYEELIITNNEQKLNQKNIGSGSSTNLNCGTNVVASNSPQEITTTCPSTPGTSTPGTAIIPVMTQRAVTEQKTGGGIYSVEAPCNPDEVVTGGGWDISGLENQNVDVIKEFAVGNAWHMETQPLDPLIDGPLTVYAECLKLAPA